MEDTEVLNYMMEISPLCRLSTWQSHHVTVVWKWELTYPQFPMIGISWESFFTSCNFLSLSFFHFLLKIGKITQIDPESLDKYVSKYRHNTLIWKKEKKNHLILSIHLLPNAYIGMHIRLISWICWVRVAHEHYCALKALNILYHQ